MFDRFRSLHRFRVRNMRWQSGVSLDRLCRWWRPGHRRTRALVCQTCLVDTVRLVQVPGTSAQPPPGCSWAGQSPSCSLAGLASTRPAPARAERHEQGAFGRPGLACVEWSLVAAFGDQGAELTLLRPLHPKSESDQNTSGHTFWFLKLWSTFIQTTGTQITDFCDQNIFKFWQKNWSFVDCFSRFWKSSYVRAGRVEFLSRF